MVVVIINMVHFEKSAGSMRVTDRRKPTSLTGKVITHQNFGTDLLKCTIRRFDLWVITPGQFAFYTKHQLKRGALGAPL
jgi:predicted ferric reductase